MRNARNIVAALSILLGMSPVLAGDKARDVRFAPGATATRITGVIRGYHDANHLLQVVEGQVLQALFSPSNRSCYFNAYEPGAEEAAHIGSSAGNEFGRSPTRAGAYRFQVYLMRNAARRNETCRFSLALELTGKPGGASAGVSDRAMRDSCVGAAAPMYGVGSKDIRAAGRIRKAAAGFELDGVVNKGREGIKRLRCIYKPDRTLDRVMAMTPDGE